MRKKKGEKFYSFIKENKVGLFLGMLALLAASLFLTYYFYITPASLEYYTAIGNINEKNDVGEIIDGTEIRQTFLMSSDQLSGIGLGIKVDDDGSNHNKNDDEEEQEQEKNKGSIDIALYKGDKELQKWTLEPETVVDKQVFQTYLDEPLDNVRGEQFEIVITSREDDLEKASSVYASKADLYKEGELQIDGQLQKGDLSFKVLGRQASYLKKLFVFLTIVLLLLLFAVFYITFHKKWSLEKIFIFASILLGIIYIFVLPPFSAPDESQHFATAYYHTSVILGEETADDDGYIIKREQDRLYQFTSKPGLNEYTIIYNNLLKNNDIAPIRQKQMYYLQSPKAIQYFPQIIGILLARILRLDNILLLVFGRFFAVLFYSLCCYFAIKITPVGKRFFLLIALLPMNIELAASYSYDVMTICAAFLLLSYIFYLAEREAVVNWKDCIVLFGLTGLLAINKVIYVSLILFCLIIPREKLKKVLKVIPFIIGFGVIFLLYQLKYRVSALGSSGEFIVDWTGTPGYTLGYFMEHRKQLIGVCLLTLRDSGSYYINTLIGEQLGSLNVLVPSIYTLGFLLILLLSTVKYESEKIRIKVKERLIGVAVICIVGAAVLASMLLSWTPMDSDTIMGVQGRYFTPALPILFIIIQNNIIVLKKNIDYYLINFMVLLQCVTILSAFEVIIMR